MRHVARVGMVLAVLLAGIVLPGSAAQACRCAVFGPEAHLAAADAAFFGKIVDRTPTRPEISIDLPPYLATSYTIDVDQVFKGQVYAKETVLAGGSSSSCGLTLPGSGSVLVYARKAPNDQVPGAKYATSLCSGTAMRDSVPAALGEGNPPMSATTVFKGELATTSDDDDEAGALPIVAGGVAVALLAGLAAVGVVMWRRRPTGGAA